MEYMGRNRIALYSASDIRVGDVGSVFQDEKAPERKLPERERQGPGVGRGRGGHRCTGYVEGQVGMEVPGPIVGSNSH